MKEKFVWLTCAGTYSEVQEDAMREYFPDVVGKLDYKEIEYRMDDYTDVIAISGNMEESEFDTTVDDDELFTLAYKLYTIEQDDEQEIVDTLEIAVDDKVDDEVDSIDCHIYHSAKEINGTKYHIYYAMDVNA